MRVIDESPGASAAPAAASAAAASELPARHPVPRWIVLAGLASLLVCLLIGGLHHDQQRRQAEGGTPPANPGPGRR
jgi:type VI protein secretion system component VasF